MNVALHSNVRDRGRLDILSLCTGGGGLDFGVELAIPGARTVCMVEREAFAVARLVSAMEAGLMAPAAIWSDARTFDGRRFRGCVDGLIGGIPCQPHSLAGKRGGSADARDLWSDARRIIVQSGAWFVLIENVCGMLTAKPGLDPGALRVWQDLRRLGFDVEGGLFTAAEVGASHERKRVFILAVADADQPGPSVDLCERNDARSQCATAERIRGRVVDAADSGRGREGRADAGAGRPDRKDGGRSGTTGRAGKSGWSMADAADQQSQERAGDDGIARQWPADGRRPFEPARAGAGGGDLGGADARGNAGYRSIAGDDRPSLFPPGPADADAWAAIAERASRLLPAVSRHDRFQIAIRAALAAADGDPAARAWLDPDGPHGLRAAVVSQISQSTLHGMADGMASRVDELRMLGNGVVSLAAAYALRTLATRLAARGSCGAAELVSMMEAVE